MNSFRVYGDFVVPGEQDDEAAGVLNPFVHRLDEACAERDVVVLDDDLVVRGRQNVRNLLRDGRDRATPAEKEIDPFRDRAGGVRGVNPAKISVRDPRWDKLARRRIRLVRTAAGKGRRAA